VNTDYGVGLSDDAGAANNLGFATSQAFSPGQDEVERLDDYIAYTLYGTKDGKPHTMGLQYPHPNNGVRLTVYYYCDTPPCEEAPHFPYNYTEQKECGSEGGLNYNWCMNEKISNATYRGFNYPHQVHLHLILLLLLLLLLLHILHPSPLVHSLLLLSPDRLVLRHVPHRPEPSQHQDPAIVAVVSGARGQYN
jgi:hypothetical protein